MQNLSSEVFGAFECDLRNIKEGAYKLPWDMTTPDHRQLNPRFALREGLRSIQQFPDLLIRRQDPGTHVGVLPFERSPLYPDYYQNNFHFQLDGWFSSQSAEMYDVFTETLFTGRQDAMQRGTLLAMNRCGAYVVIYYNIRCDTLCNSVGRSGPTLQNNYRIFRG